jgi:hypothetical protein
MGMAVATPVVGLLSGALFVVKRAQQRGYRPAPGRATDLASMVRYDATAGVLDQRVADLRQNFAAQLGRQPPGPQVHQQGGPDEAATGLPPKAVGVTVTRRTSAPRETPDTVDNPTCCSSTNRTSAVVNAM